MGWMRVWWALIQRLCGMDIKGTWGGAINTACGDVINTRRTSCSSTRSAIGSSRCDAAAAASAAAAEASAASTAVVVLATSAVVPAMSDAAAAAAAAAAASFLAFFAPLYLLALTASRACTTSCAARAGDAQMLARLTVTAGGMRSEGTRQSAGCQSLASSVR